MSDFEHRVEEMDSVEIGKKRGKRTCFGRCDYHCDPYFMPGVIWGESDNYLKFAIDSNIGKLIKFFRQRLWSVWRRDAIVRHYSIWPIAGKMQSLTFHIVFVLLTGTRKSYNDFSHERSVFLRQLYRQHFV